MKLRFLMAWQKHRKGDVIEPPAHVAQMLLRLRWGGKPYVEQVPDEQPVPAPLPEPATVSNRGKRRVQT